MELVFEGLELSTSMAFLSPDDILVLEKDKGTVQRIVNGEMLPEPLLDVNVANKSERGMLGIAVTKNEIGPTNSNKYVFVYLPNQYKMVMMIVPRMIFVTQEMIPREIVYTGMNW